MAVGLTEIFQNTADALVEHAKANSAAANGSTPRKWFSNSLPESMRPESLDDEEKLKKAFDRKELNDSIVEIFKDPTKALRAEMVSLQVQSGFVGGMIRDFRWLYRSRIRVLAHQMARAAAHADPKGPITFGIVRRMKQIPEQGEKANA